jgi:hypothetical protein
MASAVVLAMLVVLALTAQPASAISLAFAQHRPTLGFQPFDARPGDVDGDGIIDLGRGCLPSCWLAALLGAVVAPATAGPGGGGGGGAGTWKRTGDPINGWPAVDEQGAVLADGRALLTGGGPSADSAEIYDPATGAWSATANLPQGRRGHVAVRPRDGRVLIAGGQGNSCCFLATPPVERGTDE